MWNDRKTPSRWGSFNLLKRCIMKQSMEVIVHHPVFPTISQSLEIPDITEDEIKEAIKPVIRELIKDNDNYGVPEALAELSQHGCRRCLPACVCAPSILRAVFFRLFRQTHQVFVRHLYEAG